MFRLKKSIDVRESNAEAAQERWQERLLMASLLLLLSQGAILWCEEEQTDFEGLI